MRKFALLLVVSMFSMGLAVAGPVKTGVSTPKKDSVTAYDKLFKEKHEIADGMFKLHKKKEKIYFEIPLNMLNRDMLIASSVTETSDNGNGIVGGKNDPIHIKFTKSGESVQIRRISTDIVNDNPASGIANAIKRSNMGSIMKNFKIEAFTNDSSAVVIDVTSFFAGENKDLTPFDKYSSYTSFQNLKRTESFQQERSFPGKIKAFKDNIVVTSTLSYNYTLTEPMSNKVLLKDEPFTVVVSRSIVLLSEQPARPRMADYRVAVFNTEKILFSENEQAARSIYYANRWNLVPKDMDAYKAGKLSEPVKPIVFYVDSNFPAKWKPAIKEGIEQWNELFEQVGFKNAIKALDFPTPEQDPEFDPDNIKYSCVRYAPIGIENAMGPSWVDPRTGEIINASVYVYHDIIKLLNNWMFVQISPADKRIRNKNIPEAILSDGLRYVISHEVGHCLGFMHNMSASSVIPVDSLRSAQFTNKTGTTTSIMDYARFNYVAQPGDFEKGVKLTPPRFGEYDKFLIKWNYKYYPQVQSAQEEADTLSKMVSEAIKSPVYRYGKQLSSPLDPRSQTEDLGDDAIKASLYGIENLKYLTANYNDWVSAQDEDFSYRSEIYDAIVYQYVRYINHVFASVGGVYLTEAKNVDNMPIFKSVEKEKQKASLKFIMDQVKTLAWLDNDVLMKKLTIMGSANDLISTVLVKAIIAAPNKTLLSSSVSEDPYDFFECADDVFEYIWQTAKENKRLSKIDIFMHNEYVKSLIAGSNIMKVITGVGITDASAKTELFDILRKEDVSGRFDKLIKAEQDADYSPVAGYNLPSTKFNIAFNRESNFYIYLIKTRDLLKKLSKSAGSKEDKLHYSLLLKQINSTLNVKK